MSESLAPEQFGVYAENVQRFHGKKQVLFNMRMALPRGCIYGLLGPSGCGKTTFLNCILGALKVNHGQLLVLGQPPATPGHTVPGPDIGYMPQELALIEEFTLEELLYFYAKLNNVSMRDFHERKEFLVDFLELPRDARQVKTFSGGQKRRASLGVTLIHNPSIVLLDEPTVGVDPTLRAKIWLYLRKLASQGTTIIITTHYIEEARQADIVGFMRAGVMLEQGPPDYLVQKYNKDTLEDTFLHLCNARDQAFGLVAGESDQPEEEEKNNIGGLAAAGGINSESASDALIPPSSSSIPDDTSDIMRREVQAILSAKRPEASDEDSKFGETQDHRHLLGHQDAREVAPVEPGCCGCKFGPRRAKTFALMWKTYKQLIRNVAFLIFQFVLPAFQVSLFCLAIGKNPKGIDLGVIYEGSNVGPIAEFIVEKLYLQNDINIHYYQKDAYALDATQHGKTYGYISFPDGYSEAYLKRYNETAPVIDEDVLRRSTFTVRLDMSNNQISAFLQSSLALAFQTSILEFAKMAAQSSTPFFVADAIYGSRDAKFTDFIAPGIIITLAFSQSIGMTAMGFVMDKKTGKFDRLYAAGVRASEIMIAQTVAMLLLIFIQLFALLFFALVVFKLPMEGSLLLVMVIALTLGMVGMMFGLVIAAAADSEDAANQMVLGTFFPALLLSGVIWPLEAIPVPLNWISTALPTTWAASAMRSVMTRGWGLAAPEIYTSFLVQLGWMVFLFYFASKNLSKIR